MPSLTTTLNAWSADWSQFMLAVLWQSTLLAAAVAAIAWLARRASPAVRYWLWQIVAIKLLLAPVWTLGLPLAWLPSQAAVQPAVDVPQDPIEIDTAFAESNRAPDGPIEAASLLPLASEPSDDRMASIPRSTEHKATPARPVSARRAPAEPLSLAAWLMISWGSVVVLQGLWLVGQRVKLARFLSQTAPAGEAIVQIVRGVADRLRLKRAPDVRWSDVDCSPFVCGLLRPTLVLPRALEAPIAQGELHPVIVHELAHIQRGDLWFGWLPQMARIVYFFHPVAHWVAFCVRLEAELACDGRAMSATGQGAAAYANLLVRVVSGLSEPEMLRAATAGLDGQSKYDPPA